MPNEDMQTVEVEDTELVAKCQHGDTQAFNELVTKYRGKVYAMIYNMVHNEQDAWDLAQDGFLKAWKSIGRFRGQSAFYTWLYRIMMNVTIDWVRKKQITGDAEFDEELGLKEVEAGASTLPHPDPLPFQKIEREEIRKRIDEAVEKLSPEHRAVILMREMDGMQYEEIAEALDCSTGTVMSRLFYARKKLQGALRDIYENI
ncbi:MAG: sigma-70 family RNA polymerase sigma factor [Verrucomicrobiota bacterium]